MKLLALFLVAFIALSSCHIPFIEKNDWILDNLEGKKDDIFDFFEGVFSHFNLSTPSQIFDCFCDVNAGLYFKLFQKFGQILDDTKQRNSFRVHLELAKIELMFHSLKGTHACIAMTQDFTDILDALGIDERNPQELKFFLYLFYQAHYSDLFEGFKPVLDNLNTQSNKAAGDAFGAVLQDSVSSFKKEGLAHVAYAGFINGGAIALDIDDPDDSLQCFDNKSAERLLEFIYRLAYAVADGDFKESLLNAVKFVDETGKDILDKIPSDDFKCYGHSNDTQKFISRLGADFTKGAFLEHLVKYANSNRLHYYVFSKTLKKAFDDKNVHHAGSIFWKFIDTVASWKE